MMNALLNEALLGFGLSGAQAVFIRHNENAIYRVDGRYLLRIHKAAEGLKFHHDPALRRAELAFLTHLDAQGLNVQRPLAAITLSDGSMATLLTWLEGQALTKDELTPELLRQAGQLIFRMHAAAQSYAQEIPRRYDQAHTACLADALHRMAVRHALSPQNTKAMLDACAVIGSRLAAASDAFIPIHADLSPSNLLLTSDGLAPIDFSLLGLGHPMHDLSVLMGNIRSQAERQAVAQGYRCAGGHIELPLLDACYALGLLEALVIHADAWPREAWFAPRLNRWVGEELLPLAEGKPLLDENMYLINLK